MAADAAVTGLQEGGPIERRSPQVGTQRRGEAEAPSSVSSSRIAAYPAGRIAWKG
jgi:hypothetical protein